MNEAALADRVAEAEARYWVFKKARYVDAPGRAFTDAVDGYLNRVADRIRGENRGQVERLEARVAELQQVVDSVGRDLAKRYLCGECVRLVKEHATVVVNEVVEEAVCQRCGGTGEIVHGDTGLGRGGFAGQ